MPPEWRHSDLMGGSFPEGYGIGLKNNEKRQCKKVIGSNGFDHQYPIGCSGPFTPSEMKYSIPTVPIGDLNAQ